MSYLFLVFTDYNFDFLDPTDVLIIIEWNTILII